MAPLYSGLFERCPVKSARHSAQTTFLVVLYSDEGVGERGRDLPIDAPNDWNHRNLVHHAEARDDRSFKLRTSFDGVASKRDQYDLTVD